MQLPPLRPVYPAHIKPINSPTAKTSSPQADTPFEKQDAPFVDRRQRKNRRTATSRRGAYELRKGRGRRRSDRFNQPSISTHA